MLNQFIDSERIIHSAKTALACLLGFWIAKYLHFGSMEQWLIITIIVVMCAQVSVGSVLQKSLLRFLATLSGSAFAALVVWLFGTQPFILSMAIIVAVLFFSYIATSQKFYSDAGTLGAATTVIILMNQQTPTVLMAGVRFLEISAGILLAALISQFVLPIHARKHLRHNQVETLMQLADYHGRVLVTSASLDEQMAPIRHLDENIARLLTEQRKLAQEASREILGESHNPEAFKKIFFSEKEILRSINFIHRALVCLPDKGQPLQFCSPWQDFNRQVCVVLKAFAARFARESAEEIILPEEQLKRLQMYIHEKITHGIESDVIHLHAILFGAEIIMLELHSITTLTKFT